MKKINLYVDDLRDCPKGFEIARNIEQAKDFLLNFEIEILSLDHDLGIGINGELLSTGYDLVKFICEYGLRADKIYLHTDNPVGRDNMYATLKGAQNRNFIDEDIQIFRYPIVENKYSK